MKIIKDIIGWRTATPEEVAAQDRAWHEGEQEQRRLAKLRAIDAAATQEAAGSPAPTWKGAKFGKKPRLKDFKGNADKPANTQCQSRREATFPAPPCSPS